MGESQARGSIALGVTAGLLAAAMVAAVELAIVGGGAGVAVPVAALMLVLGLGVGGWIALGDLASARPGIGPWRVAAIQAAGTLLVTMPVAQHLFEGAFAATLPGARVGHLWVPWVGFASITVVLRLASARVERPGWRPIFAGLSIVGAFGLDLVNRRVQRTEYPDIHAFLVVVEVVALAIAVRLLAPARVRASLSGMRATLTAAIASMLVLGAATLAIRGGLQDRDSRWAIATRGMHGRMLVRVARLVLDTDGDEHSPWLGGGDCDDDDPEIHPGAREIAGNEIDENCDGVVPSGEAIAALATAERARTEALVDWETRPEVVALLARTREMNVLLVTVDTLRADALAEGRRGELPNLFALMDESRVFTRAFAPSAGTDLSMSGLLTGRVDPFVPDVVPLFEALGDARSSYAVIPSEVIRYVGKAILTRGLTDWERLVNDMYARDVGSYTTSHRTTELGLAQLQSHSQAGSDIPWVQWLHYFDVHEHDEVKATDKRLRRLRGEATGKPTRDEQYRLTVRLVDEQVGALKQALVDRGEWDRTIVVFASDHGEGLGEDPRLPENHGRFVYNTLVHVPLAIRIPGVAGARIDTPVSLLDVYPTLLQLAGAPAGRVDGASLLPWLFDDAPTSLTEATRPLPLNESDQFGVVAWPHKLLVRREDNLVELYDLEVDFAETHDRSAEDPTRVTELLSIYAALPPVEIDRTRAGRKKREQALTADR